MALQATSQLARHVISKTLGGAFATKAADVVPTFDWKKVPVPSTTAKDIPVTVKGATPAGDLRATSGLGLGDGIKNHTDKWLDVSLWCWMQVVRDTWADRRLAGRRGRGCRATRARAGAVGSTAVLT